MDSVLISNRLDLPFQSGQASTLCERERNSSKKEKSEAAGPFAALLPQQLSPGIDCGGDTHLIPTDDLCRGKGQPPQLPPRCLGGNGFLGES